MPRLLACLVLLLSGATASAASGWVSTATRALPLRAGVASSPADGATPVAVALGLKLRNSAQLASTLRSLHTPGNPMYGRFLTPAQFAASYAPTPAQASAVASYLISAGFSDVKIADNRLLVTATGNAALAQAAFHTVLSRVTMNGRDYFLNTADAQVPANLAGTVVSVLGLTNLPTWQHALGVPGSLGGSFSPQALQTAYDAGSVTGGATPIAIFAFGDMSGVVSDLRLFESKYSLPAVPVNVVQTGAGPWTDDAGRSEWDMDTQTSTGLAGAVLQLTIYNGGSLSDADLASAFNQFASDGSAKAGSVSITECEVLAAVLGGMATEDQIFQQAVAQGQTIFASSGDTGPTCFNPAFNVVGLGGISNGVTDTGIPGQAYPASSPYIMAAGGTTLTTNADGTYDVELAWNAGGGGNSVVEPAPDWQAPVLPVSALTSVVGKGVPDVAMDADFLLSAAALVVNGADSSNGGTSLSAPLALGAWARIESAHGNALGFAGPVLYALATPGAVTSTISGFHDVILGTNGGYPAHPGWDYCTGLGSFDIAAVSALVH